MLTYNIDNSSRYPLYEQIYMKIKKDISDGKLITGEKLPSKRELAKHLQISIITVENAYAQLLAEGYIYSQEKKGYYISDITKMMYSQMHEKKSQQIVKEKKEYFIDFVSNSIDVQGFPITIWSRLVREILLKENQKNILRSAPSQGLYELREAISKHLYQFRGMDVKPDNIVIGSGTEYLYNLLIQLLGNDLVFA
ncbi:MAG: GntR family transcriptional regulator, partial [Clostridia bacterium]|nr:GntR family transcriptional regulator [Clostridia bacterium]